MALFQQPPPRSQLENRQAANRTTALIIPALLVGIVGYATWVVVVLLGVHYLIHPNEYQTHRSRPGAGIAIIVLYFVFLIPMAVCYIRILSTVRHPGYIAKGEPTAATPFKPEETPERNVQHSCTNTTVKDDSKPKAKPQPQSPPVTMLDTKAILSGELPPPPGTERFYSKEVFVCDPNGLPIWCGTCCNWKSDRAHHGSDVGRCVLKLDHFCPWVGGVVAEKNFNFFIQFNSYAALYSLFILIVMAIFVSEIKHAGDKLGVNWIIVLALAALFTLFTGGMACNSLFFAIHNLTTIDNIGSHKRVMHLAVLINGSPPVAPSLTSTNNSGATENPLQGTITYPLYVDADTITTPPRLTFAILRTHPGMNPWNLGTVRNFKSIMGNHWYDWFVPLHHSPACNHNRGDSMYELGPDVDRLKADAGLGGERRRRKKRVRHHRDDSEDVDIMGSTLANVNGVTGRERDESSDESD